jgi:hypothetical protein
MVVAVAVIVPAFVANIAAAQGKGNSAKEEDEAQHVFNCVLHNSGFLKYVYSKILPITKRGRTGDYYNAGV